MKSASDNKARLLSIQEFDSIVAEEEKSTGQVCDE
jgi:hypothetical protein